MFFPCSNQEKSDTRFILFVNYGEMMGDRVHELNDRFSRRGCVFYPLMLCL